MATKHIHWFPGHMVKALREIETKAKYIDVFIELLDARAPRSSKNPYLGQISPQKPRLLVLTKSDLAVSKEVAEWVKTLKKDNQAVIACNLASHASRKLILKALRPFYEQKKAKDQNRGLKPQPLRALVVGIPNVGKSTLINCLVGRRSAKAANRPGLTRGQQWVKVSPEFELVDTPGILPPNYDDQTSALHLAMIGTIPSHILPSDRIQKAIFEFLIKKHPDYLMKRYDLTNDELASLPELYLGIAKRRGLLQNAEYDLASAGTVLQNEFRLGILGPIVLDEIEDA
ncbi:MAG: ribosome biogenesis GTPase YlqF [Bacilli bacterium]|jgi:ribosome biogenesis GTPase A